MKLVEDRVEELFQSPAFREIRLRFGSALAAQFIRLLVQGGNAEKRTVLAPKKPSLPKNEP
jgi:hypothetical protein